MKHELKLLLAFLISLVSATQYSTPPAIYVSVVTITEPVTVVSYSTKTLTPTHSNASTEKWHPTASVPLNITSLTLPTAAFANATRARSNSTLFTTTTLPTKNLALQGMSTATSSGTETAVLAGSQTVSAVGNTGAINVPAGPGWAVVVLVVAVLLGT